MAESKLASFRKHKDEYFSDGENSPIPPDDLDSFAGLDYFKENPSLAFVLDIDRNVPEAGTRITLDYSDGMSADYLISGVVRFEVDGKMAELAVLKDLDRGRYFLPFRDLTSGQETYKDGRYLDPQERPDRRLIVDFNYSYSPYCAYDSIWSCPLPPEKNNLDVRIEAGERVPPLKK
jgi:uncharacterized protein